MHGNGLGRSVNGSGSEVPGDDTRGQGPPSVGPECRGTIIDWSSAGGDRDRPARWIIKLYRHTDSGENGQMGIGCMRRRMTGKYRHLNSGHRRQTGPGLNRCRRQVSHSSWPGLDPSERPPALTGGPDSRGPVATGRNPGGGGGTGR